MILQINISTLCKTTKEDKGESDAQIVRTMIKKPKPVAIAIIELCLPENKL